MRRITTLTLLILLVCNVAFGATSSYSPPTKKSTSTSTPAPPTVNISKPAPTPPDTTSKPSSYTPPSKTTAPSSTASSYTPPNQTTQAKQAAPTTPTTTTQQTQQSQPVQPTQPVQQVQQSQYSQPSSLGVGLGSFAGGMILGSLVTPRQQVVTGSSGIVTTQPVYPFWYYPIKILFDLITFALICLAIWYGWKRYKKWSANKNK